MLSIICIRIQGCMFSFMNECVASAILFCIIVYDAKPYFSTISSRVAYLKKIGFSIISQAFTSQNSISSYFTIPKSYFINYTTILQYSQHPNFYFTIQHIKIIFLHNKIIYPKTQIKTKNKKPKIQKPGERKRERRIDKVSE